MQDQQKPDPTLELNEIDNDDEIIDLTEVVPPAEEALGGMPDFVEAIDDDELFEVDEDPLRPGGEIDDLPIAAVTPLDGEYEEITEEEVVELDDETEILLDETEILLPDEETFELQDIEETPETVAEEDETIDLIDAMDSELDMAVPITAEAEDDGLADFGDDLVLELDDDMDEEGDSAESDGDSAESEGDEINMAMDQIRSKLDDVFKDDTAEEISFGDLDASNGSGPSQELDGDVEDLPEPVLEPPDTEELTTDSDSLEPVDEMPDEPLLGPDELDQLDDIDEDDIVVKDAPVFSFADEVLDAPPPSPESEAEPMAETPMPADAESSEVLASATQDQIEAAIEKVVHNMFADRIEQLVIDVIHGAVTKEIDRIKQTLFNHSS